MYGGKCKSGSPKLNRRWPSKTNMSTKHTARKPKQANNIRLKDTDGLPSAEKLDQPLEEPIVSDRENDYCFKV